MCVPKFITLSIANFVGKRKRKNAEEQKNIPPWETEVFRGEARLGRDAGLIYEKVMI